MATPVEKGGSLIHISGYAAVMHRITLPILLPAYYTRLLPCLLRVYMLL